MVVTVWAMRVDCGDSLVVTVGGGGHPTLTTIHSHNSYLTLPQLSLSQTATSPTVTTPTVINLTDDSWVGGSLGW